MIHIITEHHKVLMAVILSIILLQQQLQQQQKPYKSRRILHSVVLRNKQHPRTSNIAMLSMSTVPWKAVVKGTRGTAPGAAWRWWTKMLSKFNKIMPKHHNISFSHWRFATPLTSDAGDTRERIRTYTKTALISYKPSAFALIRVSCTCRFERYFVVTVLLDLLAYWCCALSRAWRLQRQWISLLAIYMEVWVYRLIYGWERISNRLLL